MPYHLAEFYQAAQLAEFAAGAALIFALAFTKRIGDQGRWQDAAGLATAYAALVLSHLPLAVFGSLILLLYALMSIPRERAVKTFLQLSSAVILGLAASAFYWLRMVAEMSWIMADGPNPDPMVDYRQNFVFSSFSPEEHLSLWWMALLATATFLMCVPAFGAFAGNVRTTSRRALIPLAIALLFSIFMSTALSKPVWAIIPYLRMTQHPFRWLAVTSAVAPILMAASVPFWSKQFQQRQRSLALIMSGLVLFTGSLLAFADGSRCCLSIAANVGANAGAIKGITVDCSVVAHLGFLFGQQQSVLRKGFAAPSFHRKDRNTKSPAAHYRVERFKTCF